MKPALAAIAPFVLFAGPAPENLMRSIPLHFEPNVGQADSKVRFAARGGGMSIFLTGDETVLARPGEDPVRMKLRGGKRAEFEALDKLPGVSNYYRGNDPKQWREGVPHYARVRAKSVYEGVDIVYYGSERRLEYDFVVAPGADPSKIELAYEGTRSMRVDSDGDLVLATKGGELRQKKPLVYQEVDGQRVEVAAKYRIAGPAVRFELAKYDVERPLVIDPILVYGTFLGGGGDDYVVGLAVDAQAGILVCGGTFSQDFPLHLPADSTSASYEAFVTKMTPDGRTLAFSTFLGGQQSDGCSAIAVDAAGNAYWTGQTNSSDFPIKNALQPQKSGDSDAVIGRLNPAGTIGFATFLGGSGWDYLSAITVVPNGVVVAGNTLSADFPGAPGTSARRAVVVRLAADGGTRVFSRELPGANAFYGVASDGAGALYLAGDTSGVSITAGAFQDCRGQGDGVVAKLNPAGDQWIYVTCLGGTSYDYANAIGVDSAGRAHVAGNTWSADFPLLNAADSALAGQEGFLVVLNPTGTGLTMSTFLGGSADEWVRALAVASNGDIVVVGETESVPDFPLAAAQVTSIPAPGAFVTKFAPGGAFKYSNWFARQVEARAVATLGNGDVLVAGAALSTASANGVLTPDAYQSSYRDREAFIAKFSDGPPPVQVTVATNFPGLPVIVDGKTYNAPVTFIWQPGTQHTLAPAPDYVQGDVIHEFASWSQGGTAQQTVTTPAAVTTYVLNYKFTECTYTYSPSPVRAPQVGGFTTFRVNTHPLCRVDGGAQGLGWLESVPADPSDRYKITVYAKTNGGAPRTGYVFTGRGIAAVVQAGSQGSLPAPKLQPPVHGAGIYGFNWSPVAGAAGYELRAIVGCCQFLPEQLVYFGRQLGQGSTTATIPFPQDGTYAVSVRACSAAGFNDASCGVWDTVELGTSGLKPIERPSILTPSSGQILRTSTNLISWNPVPFATSYEVTLINQGNGRPELQIITKETSTVFTMRSPGYALSVRACATRCADTVTTMQFQVQLPAVSQTAPAGLTAQITNGNTLNLTWNPVTNADLYRVQVVQPNSGPGGGALTVAAKQVSATNASLQVPAGAATVVLNACNGDGCGPAATLAVNPAGPNASVPIVATPMPVVVADGPNITISWSRISGDNGSNTDYRLYVGDLSRDGPALDVITKNNFYGAYLRAEGRRYDALVFATQNGTTVTGLASGFMVAGTSATAPLITSPTHNSTFKQAQFRLAWSPIPDAVRYQYYVSRQGQSGPVLTGMTPGLFIDTALSVTSSTLHQAIVRACPTANANQCTPDSDAGWGPWSNTVTGTTNFTIVP